jgi:hypothetical protein
VAVHIAAALAEEVAARSEQTVGPGTHLDLAYVEKLGLIGQLPAWRAIAKDEAAASLKR